MKAIHLFGRGLGVVCGALLAAAWSFAMWVPSAGLTLSGISFVVALMLALFGLFAAIAAYRGHVVVVVLMFLASFFPVGVALLGADHWLKWVGRLDVGLLASAVLMWLAARQLAAPSRAEAPR